MTWWGVPHPLAFFYATLVTVLVAYLAFCIWRVVTVWREARARVAEAKAAAEARWEEHGVADPERYSVVYDTTPLGGEDDAGGHGSGVRRQPPSPDR